MDYQQHIVNELRMRYLQRKRVNPNFSLRSYARVLRIPSGALSEILNGKRAIGTRTQTRLIEYLGLATSPYVSNTKETADPRELSRDELEIFGAWYSMPLLDLLRTRNCPTDARDMGQRLGITAIEVIDGLERLQRLGLCRNDGNRFVATDEQITSSVDVPSSVLRKALIQDLANATSALETVPVTSRDFSTVTLCFDRQDLPAAKEYIRSFRRRFWKKFERPSGVADDVFQITISFFPLTKPLQAKGRGR